MRGRREPEATSAAEELAAEKDVDLSEVEGSGEEGRILKSDVQEAASDEVDAPDSDSDGMSEGERDAAKAADEAPSSSPERDEFNSRMGLDV